MMPQWVIRRLRKKLKKNKKLMKITKIEGNRTEWHKKAFGFGEFR